MSHQFKIIHSLVGPLKLVAQNNKLTAILWAEGECDGNDSFLIQAEEQLKEYFQGARKHFDIPIELEGTDFQKQVWKALEKIPYGETWSYKELAAAIGKPNAMRAVGGAVGANPISIVLPCHRVIGSNGTLTGFTGGLERKKILLALEKNKRFSV